MGDGKTKLQHTYLAPNHAQHTRPAISPDLTHAYAHDAGTL